jgi:hypothetical protein
MHMKKVISKVATGAALILAAPLAFAQTTTPTTTPGVPDTGVGGDMMTNLIMLAIAAVVVLGAAAYLASRRTV